ncbi:hypothetical protein MKX03_007799 [Papaver bracteatum]|nr:hypothetical protein MKX03_007799 [Papaver bracteatum]
MAKGHLSFLSFGFFLVLVFSEMSEENACVGKKDIRVYQDCRLKNVCGPKCRDEYPEGLQRCIVGHKPYWGDFYKCECCKCVDKIAVDTNSCNNPQNCVEECIKQANLYGPSECKEYYDGSGKYVHKCYCCERESLTASNIVAIA